MKKIFFAIALCAAITGIGYFFSNAPVVRPADYSNYLNSKYFETNCKEIAQNLEFWEKKLHADPGNFVYQKKIAGLLAADFKQSGNINQLHRSDSLLHLVNSRIPNQTGVLLSLAANAITRHAFREAEKYTTEAYLIGENKFVSSLVLTDVHLERGDFFAADYLLSEVASTGHFDYLIRKVKLLDQQGQLGAAILTMEQAAALAKASGSKDLVNWSLSNLADMYGHDGRIEKSYQTFLEALSYKPSDLHALKGIAWIAFSQDKNTTEAKRILNFLRSVQPVPDYDLMLSEIAEFEGDENTAAALQNKFLAKASNPTYGNMYKSYCCTIQSTLAGGASKALLLAEEEVQERPHPMSYALLAWSAYQNGAVPRALDILQNHVIGQTEEPVALYFAGAIFKASGKKTQAKKYLAEARDASFELGPVIKAEIVEKLAGL